MLNGGMPQGMPMMQQPQQPMNMFQRIGELAQAMRNPSAYLMGRFTDIPPEIANDPDKILAYLKQTRGLSDQDIQQARTNGGALLSAMNSMQWR